MYKLHFKVVQIFQAATFSPQTGPYNADPHTDVYAWPLIRQELPSNG